MERTEKAIRATVLQTPTPGEIETIEEALIEIGPDGVVSAIVEPRDLSYPQRLDAARQAGRLSETRAGSYLLPGFVDLHIHAPQWPQLGTALHLPLHEWLE